MAEKQKPAKKLLSKRQKLLRRLLLWSPVILLLLGIGGIKGYREFKSWRAREMAAQALQSFEQANYRAAFLEIRSARHLRFNDPKVLRASAIIDEGLGQASALEYWNRLSKAGPLSADDLEARATAAARFGTDRQFQEAASDLEAAGSKEAAGRLRVARNMLRGNVNHAIEELRRTVATSDDPALKLDLARLLLRRNVDELSATPKSAESRRIAHEMFTIVDSLQGTTSENDALAFGLSFLLPGKDGQERWANKALQSLDESNPALLPAATVLVDLGKAKPADLFKKLRPVYDSASLDRRAAFAMWLVRQQMPKEALTLIPAQAAAESPKAFAARIAALGAMGNWSGVIATANAGGAAPESIRLLARARAEYSSGYAQSGEKTLADALRAASRENTLAAVAVTGDEIGGQTAVDAALVELSGDPAVADEVFRMTRDRLGRRAASRQGLLADAFSRAQAAAPAALAVLDYKRYLQLLASLTEGQLGQAQDNESITPEDTAQAVADAPADPFVRVTHALALLRADRAADALSAFDDLTVFYDHLPPGLQAAVCAVMEANGMTRETRAMSAQIDLEKLTGNERVLLKKVQHGRTK